jgi:DNA-binding IclR family transcriptional regulator
MVEAGMLEATVESRYRLGAFFIEYYRRIRLNDPLVRSGAKFLEPMMQQSGLPCTVILARLYGNAVMCVAESRARGAKFNTSYELGRPMPILSGATSKAVLSTMMPRIARSFLQKEVNIAPGHLVALEKELSALRKSGICETHGEVDSNLVGIAAPVRNDRLGVHASLSLIMESHMLTDDLRPGLFTALSATAKLIERFMADTLHEDS